MSSKLSSQKRFAKIFAAVSAFAFPFAARAQEAIEKLKGLGAKAGFSGEEDPRRVVGLIINSVLGLVGAILLGLLVYAGFTWMTAGGNESKVENARTTIRNCIIGLVIVLLAFSISQFIIRTVGGGQTVSV